VRVEVDVARLTAARLLDASGERWLHVQAVARRAEEIAPVVGPIDRELLICAAWLHDIGHAESLRVTGFHPLDGARHLLETGWPARLAALVAHHCEARLTAAALGPADELADFPREEGPMADALVYADMPVGPGGERISLMQRLAGMEQRGSKDAPRLQQARIARRQPLIQAVARTEQRMCGRRRTG